MTDNLPGPTDEHRLLQKNVGTWRVSCTYFMDPSQPPVEVTATETVEPVGGFWTVSKFESELMGMPFTGRATLGYDIHQEQFVGTWIDGMSSVLYHYRGDYDATSHTLEMRGTGFMPHLGGECGYRNTLRWLPDGDHRFEMFVTPPGGDETRMFRYHYTRAA